LPAGDPRALRHIIPENRLRIYDVRKVITCIVDGTDVATCSELHKDEIAQMGSDPGVLLIRP